MRRPAVTGGNKWLWGVLIVGGGLLGASSTSASVANLNVVLDRRRGRAATSTRRSGRSTTSTATSDDRTTAAVEITHLTKRFGNALALDDISLSVPAGSVFGFLGPNGAGKTTTLRILTGLATPTSGTATVLGQDVRHADHDVRRDIGFLPDVPGFYPWMTARDFLALRGESLRHRSAAP